MYAIYDTFNKNIISRHRTIEAAAKAKAKFFRAFEKNNSSGSYLPIALMMVDSDGDVTPAGDDDCEAFQYLECSGE